MSMRKVSYSETCDDDNYDKNDNHLFDHNTMYSNNS